MSQRICITCVRPAELMCVRCNDPYCSLECQRADWPAHRHVCFKMPPLAYNDLDGLGPLVSNLTISKKRVDSVPSALSVESIPLLNGHVSPVPTPAAKEKPTAAKFVEEKAVAAKEKVPMKKEEIVPKAADPKKVEPAPKLVPTSQPALKVPAFGRGPAKINQAQEPKEPETPKSVMMKDLVVRAWPTTGKVKVKVVCLVDETVFFFRKDEEEIEVYYDHIAKEVAKYCSGKKKGGYKPIKDEVVLALFENEWYRAQVIGPDADSDAYIVKYIEYGNIEAVKSSDLIPAGEAVKFEICALDFFVDNITGALTEKQVETLQSENVTIHKIMKDDDGMMHCSIFGI